MFERKWMKTEVPVGSSNSQAWKVPWLALVVVDVGHGTGTEPGAILTSIVRIVAHVRTL
jgi:hypothetical protein